MKEFRPGSGTTSAPNSAQSLLSDTSAAGGAVQLRLRTAKTKEPPMAEVEVQDRYEASQSTWDKIAESQEFKDLMATKKTFIVPAFIFFVLYYFALPVLVGYAPQFMSTKVIGVNLAYLFALSQFFVAWLIAGLYVKAANNFDRLAKDIVEKAEIIKGGK
jgi:uncharacterized membrane protein (DUF485 family)